MTLQSRWLIVVSLFLSALAGGAQAAPLLLRNPSLSQDKVAFLYGGDIWTMSREGGEARRFTSLGNVVDGPFFSPDGTQIAYSARERGVTDVYVTPTNGGVPKRLTWISGGATVVGWTGDGKQVLFVSAYKSHSPVERLFKVRIDGNGPAEVLPVPRASHGSLASDGTTLAYVPVTQWQAAWKHYRGGQTTPVWLVNLKTLDLEKIPRENSNDSQPVWVGSTVYFLSDRNGAVSLYSYDTKSKQVAQVLDNKGLDLKTLSAGPGALVYEQFGSLHLYDLASHQDRKLEAKIDGDLPGLVPHLAAVPADAIQNSDVSPSGARVAVEANGDIFTLPAEKGDARNLTHSPAAADRDPSWSPDGKSIAYFSDASGEYQLLIRDQEGSAQPKVIDLGPEPSFYYAPRWSPDSKHIAFYDKHLRIWYVDAAGGKPVKIDTGLRGGFGSQTQLSWSPDSQWIAYTRDLESELHAVFLYSLATHTSTQATDGMSNAQNPVFDHNGKYLYFSASTNNGPSDAGIDLSSLDRATNSGVYVMVLAKATPSPIPPQSDDENKKKDEEAAKDGKDGADSEDKAKDAKSKDGKEKDKDKDKADKKPKPTVIDLAGIGDRILSLPIPVRNYIDIGVGKSGVVFLAEGSPVGRSSGDGGPNIVALWKFTLEKRETEQVLAGLNNFKVSFDGEKLLYSKGESLYIAPVGELKPGMGDAPQGKPVNSGGMTAMIDPRASYKQMYKETWRIERDFLYDPHHHGLDLKKIEAKYAPYLEGLASRDEFTYLCEEMLGEIQVGHMFMGGPRHHENEPKPGLLGADYSVEHDRYRFAKIYNGQNWTPALSAPLTLPGINIVQGDYLIAVNGRELKGSDNIDAFLDGTVGKQTVLKVAKSPEGGEAREATVVPVASEGGLRNLDWINSNRKKVDELSGGKIAYVYMPNTANAGYTNFNRYFYAQLDKQGLVLDERFNQGGFLADYVANVLGQKHLSNAIERDGKPVHDPQGAIFGPKAMLINESAGSGGDAMPWYFRKSQLGPLVGTNTWGGLVGIGGYPGLIDGGYVTAPRYAIYGLNGEWEVEGHGIAPDVMVEELPKDVAAGHDVQLEKAVSVVLEQLKLHPVPVSPLPPYPNFHKTDGLGNGS